jgi:two-component system LytT family response regulator
MNWNPPASIKELRMIKTIIVDDEEKSRKLLKNLLTQFCTNVQVLDLADSVSAAYDAIKKQQPDLIFLDIVMPDENGFELLEKIRDMKIEVIFTTAYDQYAIKAIRFSALDYLLKPINIDELQNAVKRVDEKLNGNQPVRSAENRINVFLENNGKQAHQKKLGLPTQSGLTFVSIDHIIYCKAEGNYSMIIMSGNHGKEMITRTLKDFEELLHDHNFFRIHRSYLVNLSHVKEYSRTNQSDDFDGDGGSVLLSNGGSIPVSRDKRKALLQLFAKPF